MIGDQQRRELTDLLTHSPFRCDHVYFFAISDTGVLPIDADGGRIYERYRAHIDRLPAEDVKYWQGNMAVGSEQQTVARFYVGYRFGSVVLVLSRAVKAGPGMQVRSPFDNYYRTAVVASTSPLLGTLSAVGAPDEELPGKQHQLVDFREFSAWRECKELWRNQYGKDIWLAIKGGRPVEFAATYEELNAKVAGRVARREIEPPILYVPPEGEVPPCDFDHVRAG